MQILSQGGWWLYVSGLWDHETAGLIPTTIHSRKYNLLHSIFDRCSKDRSNRRNLKCQYCQAGFMTHSTLMSHVKVVHLDQHKYRCSVCSKGFTVRELFEDHMNKHLNIKKHSCAYCHKRYFYKSGLRQHLRENRCPQFRNW